MAARALLVAIALLLAACGKSGAGVAAPTSASPVPPRKAAVAPPAPAVELNDATGLLVGFPRIAVVNGRVFVGEKAVMNKAEVLLAAYDLSTNTTGKLLGMAVTDPNGEFTIQFSTYEKFEFVKIEVRAIEYRAEADKQQQQQHVATLAAIINGLPATADARVAVSPVTNAIFSRFRHLSRNGEAASVAFEMAVSETRMERGGAGWAFPTSPVEVSSEEGDERLDSYLAAWEEGARYERLGINAYYGAMARDFEDGKFDGRDGSGEAVTLGRVRDLVKIPKTFFTSDVVAAYRRYKLCQRLDLPRNGADRRTARCP